LLVGEIYPGLSFVIDQTDSSRIESETRPVWDYELRALAKVLLVSSDWLLGMSDGDPPQMRNG